MRIAVLGRTRMLYESIDALINSGNEIVLIGTCAAAPEYDIRETDFERKAKELHIPYFNNVQINSLEILSILKSVKADIAVSVNWLTMIKQDAIECFKYGILNAHCGDLPRYRGNACPNWAIIKGDTNYAITIHYMEPEELDSGNILVKEYYPIGKETTIADIYENMEKVVPELFCKAIELISKKGDLGREQSKVVSESLRCFPRIPTDSFINWNESCDDIIKNIQASTHPFQGAFCYWNEIKIYFYEAKSKPFSEPCYVYPGQVIRINKRKGTVEVAAKDGVIVLSEIYIEGKKFQASDVLRSIRIRLNYCVEEEIYQLKKQLLQLRRELGKINEN